MSKIKVLIVDDSAVVRQVLRSILEKDFSIQVIGTAANSTFAMERLSRVWPDVIVLNVKMPGGDGLVFLEKIRSERSVSVVVYSPLIEQGTLATIRAMKHVSITILTRPDSGLKKCINESAGELIYAIKHAVPTHSSHINPQLIKMLKVDDKLSADVMLSAASSHVPEISSERIVAIGTSTGGTQALEFVLMALPSDCPGIVIVQHMPEKFTAIFAERLNSQCEIEVREAMNNDRVLPGLALIAPGGKHMMLKRSGYSYQVEVKDGPLVNRHCPSVDVLFRSVAKFAGRNATGIIMTGMGDDGARGMKEMHEAGVSTIAQDELSCVVFGMPKEAIKLGGVDRIMPLQEIPSAILNGL